MRPSAKKYKTPRTKKKVDVERQTSPPAQFPTRHEPETARAPPLCILLKMFEIDRQHPVPDEDDMKDLKNLIFKMNGLVDKLK